MQKLTLAMTWKRFKDYAQTLTNQTERRIANLEMTIKSKPEYKI